MADSAVCVCLTPVSIANSVLPHCSMQSSKRNVFLRVNMQTVDLGGLLGSLIHISSFIQFLIREVITLCVHGTSDTLLSTT